MSRKRTHLLRRFIEEEGGRGTHEHLIEILKFPQESGVVHLYYDPHYVTVDFDSRLVFIESEMDPIGVKSSYAFDLIIRRLERPPRNRRPL